MRTRFNNCNQRSWLGFVAKPLHRLHLQITVSPSDLRLRVSRTIICRKILFSSERYVSLVVMYKVSGGRLIWRRAYEVGYRHNVERTVCFYAFHKWIVSLIKFTGKTYNPYNEECRFSFIKVSKLFWLKIITVM